MTDLKNRRVLVTGGGGFLGRELVARLEARGALVSVVRSADYDLTDPNAVIRCLSDSRPELVLHAAAVVGGIGANRDNPARFFYENAVMGLHLIHESMRAGVEKMLIVGTVCAYPKFTPVPFSEDEVWNGYPEETNAPYGLAKKMLLAQSQAYRIKYGFNSVYLIPTNLYGPRDNFDLETSHVIPAMIRKFVVAKETTAPKVVLWGTGSASREFLYVDDAAEGLVRGLEGYDGRDPINLGSNHEISIKDLAEKIASIVGFEGVVEWDSSKPDGQPRRAVDGSRAKELLGWEPQMSLDEGLAFDHGLVHFAARESGVMKRALITGVTGQDGSYLAELLISKGYEVHGLIRRSSSFNTERLDDIYRVPHESEVRFLMHYADLSDSGSLVNLIRELEPDEIYHLGAQSHVQVSFKIPEYTSDTTGMGTVRILEAIRAADVETHFYNAASSEMFGSAPPPQSETTPFHPRSPYGVAKVFSYWMTVNYREAFGMHASNGILFNHESPRRGETFVTRKITRAVARIKAGMQDKLFLGNLDAKRDWGYAPEYVEAMWMMLQQERPDDYVIATGEAHTVREFCELSFGHVGLDWERHVEVDPRYYRPAEVDYLLGDSAKGRKTLGWEPRTSFESLVTLMVDADIELLDDELQGRLVRLDREH